MKFNNKSIYIYMAVLVVIGVIGIKLHSKSPIVVPSNDITLANLNAILGIEDDEEEGGGSDAEKGDTDPEKGTTDPEKGTTDPEKGTTDPEKGYSRNCKRIVSSYNCIYASGLNKGQWCSLAITQIESYTPNSSVENCNQFVVKPCQSGCIKKTN